MGVWRRVLALFLVGLYSAAQVRAQSDTCVLQYQAYSNGDVADVPDDSGELILAYGADAIDELTHTDSLDGVIPPFAPPGGWFVAVDNPSDSGLFWARRDTRLLDPNPGTRSTYSILLHPRFDETAVDSVELAWPGTCFTPPNVTVLSMGVCASQETIVADMTAVTRIGIGRISGTAWDDEQICLEVRTGDDLVASVKLLLEGPATGSEMVVPEAFSNSVPLTQPYTSPEFDGTHLDFDSLQVAAALPDSTIDWLLVGLRAGEGSASTLATSVHAAILLTDGTIVESSGAPLRFPGVATGGYRLVAAHRNHMAVMSADTLDLSDGIGSWDFTTGLTQAYMNGGMPMKDLGSGVFGLFAADGNADGQTTAPDFNLWNAATTAGATGYVQSDYNMDGQVTAPDFNLWNANTTTGAESQVPQ